ncbi:segregation/condensation protein A [Salinimonas sp. HHU 13199]|uniref:Segregation and condensation protein A n=1 Tax=Salinimonas profundi TaxID=2729140 RepID=A0ABR8LFL4_9ALTE|nr:ScpA family protein [Salinimonas profundi]MBD3585048.1 segregation/condensation protein A [Salinimonas profundi]
MSEFQDAGPVQQPLPLAFIHGQALIEKPQDLYIPPEALEVILESFEGPLDLLLYLIKKQKFDITTLPVAQITAQYMEYVEAMTALKLELAAEYLVMAAVLAEIKSRLLLPKPPSDNAEEDDPRAELIRRLKEYEVVKDAAREIDAQPRIGRDIYAVRGEVGQPVQPVKIDPDVALDDIVHAFRNAMKRAAAFEHHTIEKEVLSTRERMSRIMEQVSDEHYTPLDALFTFDEGRAGCVVSFLAILELVKEQMILCTQAGPYARIYVKLGGYEED